MAFDRKMQTGWALYGKNPRRIIRIFPTRDLAIQAGQTLGEENCEVRFGRVEKDTGNFITPDLDKQR